MFVTKASGEKEKFDSNKIYETCVRAGATEEVARSVAERISKQVYDGVKTSEIELMVKGFLRELMPGAAARYALKRAIMMLGPSGYSFEKFFSRVLSSYGYETMTNVHVRGRCVIHEVDVVAKRGDEKFMVECKYHNAPGIKTDLKVAMYTYARYLDLKEEFSGAWLVSNTKLTWEAIKFSECVGLKVISWRYPRENCLEKMIERKKLYPVTILSLSHEFAKKMVESGIITIIDLAKMDLTELRRKTQIPIHVLEKAVSEAEEVLKIT